jgi:hypothetical protein
MRKREPRERLRIRKRSSRARKRQRELVSEHDAVFALDLQALYQSRQLASDVWIPVAEFVANYGPGIQDLLTKRSFAESETANAVINGEIVRLIRPKFLPGETERKSI